MNCLTQNIKMMNKLVFHFRLLSFFLLVTILVTSCQSSNSVVSNRLIQKRKYTSGWFVNNNKKQRAEEESVVIAKREEARRHSNLITNTSERVSANLIVIEEDENDVIKPFNPLTDEPVSEEQTIEQQGDYTSSQKIEDEPTEVAPSAEEEVNKAAVASFVLMLLGALFLGVGFAIWTVSETYFLLTVSFVVIGLSLIFAILALTKYKHIERRKKLARITLYTLIFGPIVAFVVMLIVGLIWLASGAPISLG